MVEFISGTLARIVKHAVPYDHRTKGEKRRTRFYESQPQGSSIFSQFPGMVFDGTKSPHKVVKVTLRSGENFAVDLAGAQYGHHEPVVPWEKYQHERILNVIKVGPPVVAEGLLHVNDYSQEAIDYFHMKRHEEAALPERLFVAVFGRMNPEMLNWQAENLALKDMWKLSEERFLSRQEGLVDYVHWAFNWDDD